MNKKTVNKKKKRSSIFEQLGFKVCGYTRGTYHLLKEVDGEIHFEGIGLLFSAAPLNKVDSITFFSFNGINAHTGARPTPAKLESMLAEWGDRDARRFQASGLQPECILDLADVSDGQINLPKQKVLRSNGIQHRHYAILDTGDVICYN